MINWNKYQIFRFRPPNEAQVNVGDYSLNSMNQLSCNSIGNVVIAGGGGAAHIFSGEGSDTNWVYTRITGQETALSRFASSVSLNEAGNIALITAPGERNGTGAAYIFTNNEVGWSLSARLTPPTSTHESFGFNACAINSIGNLAFVSDTNLDRVCIYSTNNNWINSTLASTIQNIDANSRFGYRLEYNSFKNILFVGEFRGLVGENNNVYVYSGNGNVWSQVATIPCPSPDMRNFGNNIKLNKEGNLALIAGGASGSGPTRRTWFYMYSGNNNTWTQIRGFTKEPQGGALGPIVVGLAINSSGNIFTAGYPTYTLDGIGPDGNTREGAGIVDVWTGDINQTNWNTSSKISGYVIPQLDSLYAAGFGYFTAINSSGNIIFSIAPEARVPGQGAISPRRGALYVSKALLSQTITFPEISNKSFGDPAFFLSASSDSNLPLSYSSNNPLVASISGATGVKINNLGSVTITATQTGNYEFNPAIPVSRSFNVVCDYVQDIDAARHVLTVLKNGGVTGWGFNNAGQLNIPNITNAVAVSAGEIHSVTLLKDGSITAWGNNDYGQLNIPVGIGTNATGISAGGYHTLALLKDGRVTGWGRNNYGQINIPASIGTNAAAVLAHYDSSVALLKNSSITGWGQFDPNLFNNFPQSIQGNVTGISAGDNHYTVLLKNGSVTGWGLNSDGQLNIPVGIGTGAAAIANGAGHCLALLKNNNVIGWGRNFEGQINIPPILATGNITAKIAAHDRYSFALLKDGRVTGWGANYLGELNVPRTLNCLPPNSSRVISAPTSTYILSGQSLSNAPLIGGSGNVPGVFSWTDSSFVPSNVGRFSYSVTFVPSDIGSYATSTTGSFVNVLGITNIITKPIGTSIKYGQTLVNSNLTNGVANVPGTFNWTNPQTIVNNVGVYNYPVTFIPTSEYYINALTDANLNITKANQTINFPNIPVINKTITSSYNLNATSDNNQTPITYTSSDTNIATINGNVLVILNEGTCVITAKQNETSNYLESNSISRNLQVVTRRAPNILTVSNLPNGVYYDEVTQCIIGEITDQGNYHIKIYIQEGEEICEKTLILNVSDKNKKYIYGVNNPVNIGFIKYNPQDRINQQAIIQLYDNPKYGKMLIHSKLGIIYGYSKDIEQKIEAYNHPVYGYILRDSIGGIIYGYTGDFVNDPNFINSLYGL